MSKQFDVHTIANNARDIRGDYMAQSLRAVVKAAKRAFVTTKVAHGGHCSAA